jgi:hypothetical protein
VASRSSKRLFYPPPHITRSTDLVGCHLPLQLAGMSRVAGPAADIVAELTSEHACYRPTT